MIGGIGFQRALFRAREASAAFLRWWLGELTALLPASLRGLLARPRTVVEVPASQVLRRSLVLPQAAEATLRETVAYQIRRLTPFPPDDVCFGCRVAVRDAGAGTLLVDFVAVRREDLAALLVPDGGVAVVKALDGCVIEIPLQRDEASPPLPRIRVAAAVGCAALAMAVVALPYYKRGRAEDDLAARIAQLRVEADASAEVRRRLEIAEAREAFVPKRRAEQPLAVDLLAEVTRVLPDDAWLDYYELRGATLRVSGHSAQAAPLLTSFAASRLFDEPAFSAPITQDPATALERFDITLRVRGGRS